MPGAPDTDPFATFEIELSPADRNLFYLEALGASHVWQLQMETKLRQARQYKIAGAVLLLGGLTPLIACTLPGQQAAWLRSGEHVPYGLVVAGIGAWLITMGTKVKKALDTYVESLGRRCNDPLEAYTQGRLHYEFSEAGIQSRSTHRTATAGWPMVNEVFTTPSFVMVSEFGPGAYLIPRSAFASDAAVTEFVARVRAIIKERGASVADRIRAHLTYHDVKCPKCAYDLKGSTGEACPECGLALTLLNIPAAAEQAPG